MQVGARLEREEQRRRTDDDAVKVLVAAAREAEAAALAAKQEAARNAEEHATRYRFPGRSIPAAVGLQNSRMHTRNDQKTIRHRLVAMLWGYTVLMF